MADSGMIEVLVNEMAGCVNRKTSDEEKAGLARSIHRRLGDLSNEQLSRVADSWIDAQSDKNPAFKLPAVATLADIAKRITVGTRASREKTGPPPPRPEFVEAHRRFRSAMTAINKSLLPNHDHRNGPERCPVCGPQGDDVRNRIQDLLDGLPAPLDVEDDLCCDGGWRDEEGGRVSPCPTCNPYFDQWKKTG